MVLLGHDRSLHLFLGAEKSAKRTAKKGELDGSGSKSFRKGPNSSTFLVLLGTAAMTYCQD